MTTCGKISVSILLGDITRENFWKFFYQNIFLKVIGF